MESGIQSAVQKFIQNLIKADTEEIEKYAAEITMNSEFHNGLEEKRSKLGRGSYFSWGLGIGTRLGTVLYVLCRKLRPDAVVETGVASGVSSAYFLCALEENKHGELYSIDLPWQQTAVPKERQNGWIIPDYLRHRWQLILGRSSRRLAPLLEELGEIDIFLHDSEHSYENMLWEFQTAWAHLKTGGILLSHNIDMNDAFSDFCRGVGGDGFLLANMGAILKV